MSSALGRFRPVLGGFTAAAGFSAVKPSAAPNRCNERTATRLRVALAVDSGTWPSVGACSAARKAETSLSDTLAGSSIPRARRKSV